MDKVTTTCGKVIYFGIQTPKGNNYFGENAEKLTPFMRKKSIDIVSIDNEIVQIYSEEHPNPGEYTYYLTDGRSLEVRPVITSTGYHKIMASFGKNWK